MSKNHCKKVCRTPAARCATDYDLIAYVYFLQATTIYKVNSVCDYLTRTKKN